MCGRRLTQQLLVLTPLALLCLLGLYSRTYVDPWQTPAETRAEQDRISAYIEPVRLVLRINPYSTSLDSSQVRAAAKRWIQIDEQGLLKPIPPIVYGETCQDGVRGQVLMAQHTLMNLLRRSAEAEAGLGHLKQASQDLATLVRIGAI